MGTSYRRIEAVRVSISILHFLSDQKEPVVGQEVARAMDIPHGTVMCHLKTLEDERLVRCVGDAWELDLGMAVFWARIRAKLETRIESDTNDLRKIGVIR